MTATAAAQEPCLEKNEEEDELWEVEWRREVCYEAASLNDDDSIHYYWRQLAEWEQCFSNSATTSRDVLIEKNRAVLIQQLQNGISCKVTDVMLEVIARVMGMAEDLAQSYVTDYSQTKETESLTKWLENRTVALTASNSDTTELVPTPAASRNGDVDGTPVANENEQDDNDKLTATTQQDYLLVAVTTFHVLNCLNAAVLTFRFERFHPSKFLYIRRLVANQVAHVIQQIVEKLDKDKESTQTADTLFELRKQAWDLVDSHKASAKEVVVQLMDERVTQAADQALDGALTATDEMLDTAEQQLNQTMDTNGAVTNKVAKTGCDTTNKIRQALSNKGKETKETLADKNAMGDQIVSRLAGIIQNLVLGQMNGLFVKLIQGMDSLLESLSEIHEKRKQGMTLLEIQTQVLQDFQDMHADLQQSVLSTTQTAVKVITFGMNVPQLQSLVEKLG